MLLACHRRSNIARHVLFLTVRSYTATPIGHQARHGLVDEDDDESLSLPIKLRSERLLSDEQKMAAQSDFYKVSHQAWSKLKWKRLYPQRFELTRHPRRDIWPSKAEQSREKVEGNAKPVTEVSRGSDLQIADRLGC